MGVKTILKKVGKVAAKGAVGRVLGPDAATTLFGGTVAAGGVVGTVLAVASDPSKFDSFTAALANIEGILVQVVLILTGLGLMKTRVGAVLGKDERR